MLKRKPSLTDQARAYIKQRILNDEFDDGRIPAEMELAEMLGVSRTTIRDALARLELEGVIYRKQGAGTFVNRAGLQIQTRLEAMWDYEAVLAEQGYEPSTQILEVREETAVGSVAVALDLPPGSKLVVFRKLFLADDEPVILATNRIPHSLIQEEYTAEDFSRPVYRFLWEKCQQPLTYYLSEIAPAMATGEVAAALQLGEKRPLIAFREIGYNDDNQPILKAHSYFRDDLLRLRLIRREVQ